MPNDSHRNDGKKSPGKAESRVRGDPPSPVDPEGKLALTQYEREIISALTRGQAPKQIRAELNATEGGMRRTLHRVRRRWGARTTIQVCAMYARLQGDGDE